MDPSQECTDRVQAKVEHHGQTGKLIEQLLRDPPEARFDDIQYLLEAFGFEEKRSKGSHHTFRSEAGLKITVPKKGGKMVKAVYIRQIVTLLQLEEENDEDTN
jgi:predicted RNA binding protein YcfA (HicA-like mRNA interferase family)